MKNSLDEFLKKYSSVGQRQPSPSTQSPRDTVDDFLGKYTSGGKPKEENVDDFISRYTSSGKGSFGKDYSSEPIVDYEEMKRLKLGERATEIASEYNPYSSTTAAQRHRVDEAVKGIGYQGLDQYNLGVASTGKFLGGKGSILDGFTNELRVMLGISMQDIGQGIRETGEALGFKPKDDSKLEKLGRDVVKHDANYADKVYEHYKNIYDQDAAYYAKNAEGSKGLEAMNKYGPTIVAAIPNAIQAIMSSGMSLGKDAAVEATRGMSLAGKTGMDWVRQAVKNSAVRMVENPQFKMSFIETVGSNYMDAIESGASPEVASIYATLVGSVNSAIEVGGGIETLPADIRNSMLTGDKNKVLLEYAKSIGSEGLEEVEQGIVERGFKPLIGEETHLLPDEGRENVVLDPYSMAEEFKGGAVAAGFLGAPSTIYGYSKAPDVVKDVEPEIVEETDIPRYEPYSPSDVTKSYLNEIKAGRSEDGRINRAQLNKMLDERDKILEQAKNVDDKDVRKKLEERAESISEAVAITLRKDLKVGNSEVYYKTGVDVDGLLGTRESPPISAADIPPDLPRPEKINYADHIYGSDERSEDVKKILAEAKHQSKYVGAYELSDDVKGIVNDMLPEKGSDKPVDFKSYYSNLRKLGDIDKRLSETTDTEERAKLQGVRDRLAEGIAYVMRYNLGKSESAVYQATGVYVDAFNRTFVNPMGYIYRPDGSIIDISGQHIIWDTKNVIQGDVSTSEYRTGKYAEDRGVAAEFNARDLSKPASAYGGSTADPYLTEPEKRRVGSTEINTTSDMNVNVMSPDEVFDELYARGLINPNRIKFEVITDAALEKVAESSKVTRNSWLRSKINYELDKRNIKREQIAAESKASEAEPVVEETKPSPEEIASGVVERKETKAFSEKLKTISDNFTNIKKKLLRNARAEINKKYGLILVGEGYALRDGATGMYVWSKDGKTDLPVAYSAKVPGALKILEKVDKGISKFVRDTYKETGFVIQEDGSITNGEDNEVVFQNGKAENTQVDASTEVSEEEKSATREVADNAEEEASRRNIPEKIFTNRNLSSKTIGAVESIFGYDPFKKGANQTPSTETIDRAIAIARDPKSTPRDRLAAAVVLKMSKYSGRDIQRITGINEANVGINFVDNPDLKSQSEIDAEIDALGEKSRERRNLVNPQFWQDAEVEEERPDTITHAEGVSLGREYDEKSLEGSPFTTKTKSALDARQTTGMRNSMLDAQKMASEWSEEGGGEHTVHSDELVNATAEELLAKNGYDAETERLENLPIGQWTDVDIVEANTIIRVKTHELQEDSFGMAKSNRLIVEEESRRLADLRNRREEAIRRTSRVQRQANRSVVNQYQNIMERAEKIFSTKKEEARGAISPNNKMADTLRAVKDFASRIFFSADKDTNEIISLIHEIAEYRGTSKVLGGKAQKLVDAAIRKVAQMEGGYEFLRNIAFAQADAITTDAISGFRGSTLESIKTYRVAALLSGLKTWINNFGNNSVSIFASATNQNLGIGFDKMFSNITGTRTIGKDTSWKINKANMKAVEDAMLKAMLNVMFDVNVDSDGNPTINPDAKYENSGNNWFKMSGNVAEQVLAQFQMLIRTTLVVPDEIAKAQIRQGLSKNVDGMTDEAKAELKNDTEAQASYRTFQNKGTIAKAINYIRDGMNKWQIKDRKGGTIGIGDIVAVFATVPANVVEHRIENSPIGWTKSTVNMLLGVYKAKKGELSATEQAKISRDCGRTLGSVGLAAASAFMASLGALGNADFEDDDERKAALKDNGVDGLFLNLDGFARALAGQDSRYAPGDKVVDLDWLEVFSVPVAIGSFMGLSLKEGDNPVDAFWNAGKYSIDNTWETILSLPGMDAIKRLSDGVKFSKEEKTGAKIADGILPYLSSTLMSYVVPNVVPQFAAGIDNKARDVYNADSPTEKARNVFLERSGIFRGALPTKKDNFGRTVDYGGFQNKALFPGPITKTKSSPVEKELNRLSNQGLSGAYPQKSAPSKIEDKALNSEQRRKYEATYSKTYNETVDGVMNSFGYKRLSDSQKNDALKMAKSYAKDVADAEARRALGLEAKELQGWKNLSKQDRTMFISARENISGFYKLKDGKQTLVDYSGMDNFIKKYGEAAFGREKVVEAITSTFSKADDIYEASKVGINSKTYMSVYEAYKKIDDNEDLTNTQKTIKLKQVISATAHNDEQKEFLEDNLKYYNHMAAHSDSYDEMVDMGIPEVKAEKTYNSFKALTPLEGKKTVSDKQKYKAIASMTFLTDEEKWKVFDSIATDAAIRNSKSGRVSGSYNDWLVNSKYR